jgi:hypothetical protein
MRNLGETPATISDRRVIEMAASLWEEYSYRHDLIWKMVFRITAVATALAIAPFLLNERAQHIVGGWLALLPALSVLIVVLGLLALPSEFAALDRIKRIYQWSQDKVFGRPEWKKAPTRLLSRGIDNLLSSRKFGFSVRIYGFLLLVLAGTCTYLVLFLTRWSSELK